jgi:hypothetical protein
MLLQISEISRIFIISLRFLVLATVLDPRYKLDFFKDTPVSETARLWLLQEAEEMAISIHGRPREDLFHIDSKPQNDFQEMIESFLSQGNVPALPAEHDYLGSSVQDVLDETPSPIFVDPIEKASVVSIF